MSSVASAHGEQSQKAPSIPAPTNRDAVRGLRVELRQLFAHSGFRVGLALKILSATFLGGKIATTQFTPILYQFSHHPLTDPYAVMLSRGLADAFPYGPVMLLWMSLSWFPTAFFSFDSSSYLGLFLLRLPVLAADVLICVLLLRWLNLRPRIITWMYWLNPILIYATYVHGQLDLVPTAFLCMTLFLLFERRIGTAGVVYALGLGAKLHLLVALPFLFLYLYRVRRYRKQSFSFVGTTVIGAAAIYAFPLTSTAFRRMVFDTPQSDKLWATILAYGEGSPTLFLAPAFLLLGLLTFANYRKVNREVTLMFLGAMYMGLMALVPPQPGWYLWSLPFVVYMGAQFSRTRRIQIAALSAAYLGFFCLARLREFLENFDSLMGPGFADGVVASIQTSAPGLLSPRFGGILWTVLFCASVVTAFEMFRRGVTSNAVYNFRDQPFTVGIGGDSGAGKHTIGNDLSALMGRQVTTLHGDDDHKWERGHEGWGEYSHLDPRANLLVRQFESLSALRRGSTIEKRHYDHDVGQFTDPVEVEANSFFTIIGLHPFYLPSQRQLLDLKVFVHPDEEVRRTWKIARDMAKRGYTKEKVLAQIEQRMPDWERYLKPQMKYADVVVRMKESDTRGTDRIAMEIEIASDLASLNVVDALDHFPTIQIDWEPDPNLTRDKIGIVGTASVEQIQELAAYLVVGLDDLIDTEEWQAGGSGVVQIVLLHAISTRLRSDNRGGMMG